MSKTHLFCLFVNHSVSWGIQQFKCYYSFRCFKFFSDFMKLIFLFLIWVIRHVICCAFVGTEVNTTVIGENDPIDEVQGFLFGRLRYVYSFGKGVLSSSNLQASSYCKHHLSLYCLSYRPPSNTLCM